MKGPREYKRIIARMRRRAARRMGKRNGQLGWIDDPWLERLIGNSKRNYQRSRYPLDQDQA